MMRREVIIAVLAVLAWPGAAANAEEQQVCIHAVQASYSGETIACYSDAGCLVAETMGGDPVRDYDEASAPFALARGKIAAIVTSSTRLMKAVVKAGGRCSPFRP